MSRNLHGWSDRDDQLFWVFIWAMHKVKLIGNEYVHVADVLSARRRRGDVPLFKY